MTLSEELQWRGFVNQTTYKDLSILDGDPITFYWGVDPSADSMTIGHLSIAMMARHLIRHGHKAVLLVGGATGLIGDPDGKARERQLQPVERIAHDKKRIAGQYQALFADQPFEVVDNYDWFKDIGYLDFLRDIGKHVPMRQMLGRDFVQSRLGEESTGISYAEFSYSLIQGYDFLHLHRQKGVTLQICGADQWGNSVTGVDLIRRLEGDEAHVLAAPLVVNQATGMKFGKTEDGAIWLDAEKTTPTQFYQFWINTDDQSVENYLRIYTTLDQRTINRVLADHQQNPGQRLAQAKLAKEVTRLVHGEDKMALAQAVTYYLIGQGPVGQGEDPLVIKALREEIPSAPSQATGSVVDALVQTGLATSNTDARRLIGSNAVSINGQKIDRENFKSSDFHNGRLLLRRGKAFKDSALIEVG